MSTIRMNDLPTEQSAEGASLIAVNSQGEAVKIPSSAVEDGQDGQDGYSPTVSLSKSGKTTTLVITDKNGTHSSTIVDGNDGQDGRDGTDGTNGQDGADGQDGVSPSVTVSTIQGGHQVTITDAEHPQGQSFNVMDGQGGGIPDAPSDGKAYVRKGEEWVEGVEKSEVDEIATSVNVKEETDSLYITDRQGYIVAKINAQGLSTNAITLVHNNNSIEIGRAEKRYGSYELFSLGDSLSQGGQWQTRCAGNLGCVFSQERNVRGGLALSVGGTKSFGTSFDIMPWRAKHLIDANYISGVGSNAIIVLENVNDGAETFDPTAKAYNLSDPIEGYAYEDFGATLLDSIPVVQRKLDACFRLTETQVGKNLAITTLPSREGDVTLKVGWSAPGVIDYNIHVVPQETDAETRQYVLERILEYNYSLVTDTLAEDTLSVNFSNGSSSYPLTVQFVDTDNTGMAVSITDTNEAKTSLAKYFNGASLTDWTDTTKWKDGLTYSEGWKTTIEMLQKAFPDAMIIVSLFPSLSYTAADYQLYNGLYNVKSYYDSARMVTLRTMRTNLSAIADFYTIPFADLFKDSGISITNLLTFYNANANVHPKSEGQNRWGDIIAAIIRRFI